MKLATALAICSSAAHAFEARLETTADDDLAKRLRAASAVIEAADTEVTAPEEIIAAVQSDYRTLIGTLYREGYYGPRISIRVDGREGASMSLISLPSQVQSVVIEVTPGQRFVFGETTVAPLARGTELPADFKRGEVAHSYLVGDATEAAIESWREASHAKAVLKDQSIIADHPEKTLDVDVEIDPGPAVKFGKLQFSGRTTVRDGRLSRIANLPTGSSYHPEKLDLVTKRLQKTGTFRSITLREAEELNADGTLDITATLIDDKPRRLGFGAELSSLEGGTLSAYWMHRNITNNADRLRFDAEISGIGGTNEIDATLSASYRRPATVTRKTTLVLAAELEHLNEPDYTSDIGEFTFGFDVETSPNSTFYAGLGYRYSQVEDDLGSRDFSYIILPIEGSRDTRDNSLNPTRGTYFEADITPFLSLNEASSGVRIFADGRSYISFGGDDRFILAGRVQLGSISGADYTDVSTDMLFFSGGGGTVRGQPYQSLGVDLGSGDEIGGSSFLGLSGELRAKVKGNISAVGFYDLGGIGTTALPGEDAEWHAGAGLGLRYNTGFGPIRLDLAGPVSGDTGDGLQIYIGIGQAF
ncbi:autotransporter assembly complex protein TamA [Celeribacter halophilus]|uniref:Autotransporter secretion outer membrane protein TamA n=1 Tax=Celeribacter halophilus TaxID=576117 RepID=A0A1I3MHH2_9RHOB|nr:autotransporter assembly complex family protein [Celeribacter halophilus]PZX15379.1 autotransporter secretion outer membrane protein TamA [Celeribacter halophilus]SFI96372.1 autotransporter secretion outer membrane protein TamA [Celeribacter halophilus]